MVINFPAGFPGEAQECGDLGENDPQSIRSSPIYYVIE